MNYCTDCRCVFEGGVCPGCGTANVREAADNDFCFLTEQDSIKSSICEGALNAEGIQCVALSDLSGIEMSFALPAFRRRLYVPFGQLAQAINVLKETERAETEKIKRRLMENSDKIAMNGRLLKKIKIKSGMKNNDEVRFYCIKLISNAERIEEDGVITGCPYGGHYIFCYASGATVALNSQTFEILSVKVEKRYNQAEHDK